MQLSRRSFLGGALALAGAALVVEPIRKLIEIPTLWGDGIHHDSAGLEAALNGRPVHVMADGLYVRGQTDVLVKNGTFLLERAVVIPSSSGTLVTLRGCVLKATLDRKKTIGIVYSNDGSVKFCADAPHIPDQAYEMTIGELHRAPGPASPPIASINFTSCLLQ